MGRKRIHNEATAVALLDAAEAIVAADGLEGLTVRRVAEEVGTTTRAVYSSLGSKEALLTRLSERAFDLLAAQVAAVPRTDDPVADLVAAGTLGFRLWALEHPALFEIGFLRDVAIPQEVWLQARPAVQRALDQLLDLIRRIEQTGGLAGRTVEAATWQFDCLCEGLVIADLRSNATTDGDSTLIWADALTALVVGWRSTGHHLSSVPGPRYDWLAQP
jgi:AcrR family transcriptional regulator